MLMARHYNIDARGGSAGLCTAVQRRPGVCVCVVASSAQIVYVHISRPRYFLIIIFPFFLAVASPTKQQKGNHLYSSLECSCISIRTSILFRIYGPPGRGKVSPTLLSSSPLFFFSFSLPLFVCVLGRREFLSADLFRDISPGPF
jgi:hypothetical protein